ncbi:tRNA 2'-phosphotransferase [Cryptococcus wingfieldii CBS 7118]|uniref:2'-phosphotransferase n=1 Tax=Cryptococcus wingfieldii CBS 7118 TaxID=1295528 RepID=A0A1E3JII0_9TREE|nr:tRNA 2'-phosphotransferase [Cryptococcus wingfieldii CBS 7118]ODO00691.1 tRNA 2'-phosphotransferase [Cryptococcus wingfieldii CBS 7118]
MPRPPETPEVRNSKTLAYILRHGAEKEGLYIRQDGYIKLVDVLARPKMKGVDKDMVIQLVRDNAKQRFELFWGYDPSPPRPKKKPTQGKTKKQLQRDREAQAQAQGGAGDVSGEDKGKQPDAAAVDNLQASLVSAAISSPPSEPAPPPDLPLVSLPLPTECSPQPPSDGPQGEYFIRASQGHSIQLESTAHLEEVKDDEDGRARVGELVHGTRWELWDVLKEQGLSKMTRQHIHFAPSLTGRITPRPTSTLYIYLDLTKLVQAGIPIYTSANGVVLTPGGEGGIVGKEFWAKAVRKVDGKRVIVWQDGKEVEKDE